MTQPTRRNWTRDELVLAINLYCKTPFGKIHVRNPEIIELAKLLQRSAGAVSYKLANFASIDTSLARVGASNVSKLDREVWDEFFNDWDALAYESECLLVRMTEGANDPVPEEDGSFPDGRTRQVVVEQRVNQRFFRRAVLASYDEKCCITGLGIPELLIASHIVPWSEDKSLRTNPRNGLCLNALHDRAFDSGLIVVEDDFRVRVSPDVLKMPSQCATAIQEVDGLRLKLPRRFVPSVEFLRKHRERFVWSS